MPKIRLENVRKTFKPDEAAQPQEPGAPQSAMAKGPHVALDGLNLLVHDGETMAVLGPSGCGKSTLLRVVAGLVDYEGHVYFDGRQMEGVKPSERNLGMVTQDYALYPHLDGYDNLGFTFRVRRRPRQEAEERIRATSELMGIGFAELLRYKPGRLAGGEQQRLAVGRALVRAPHLLLFDEPLSNLDARLRVYTRGEIKQLLGQFGHTAIYVTHDQVEATAMGDRLAIMNVGRVEQVGTYSLLYEKPINTFVAGFLGSPPMNLLSGAVDETGSWGRGDLKVPVPDLVQTQLRPGHELILGIRPEHARLAVNEPPAFSGRVLHIERDLPRRIQTLFVECPPLPEFAVTVPSAEPVLQGDRVPVMLPLNKLIFFDGRTERRIG
jgi:multiple sugar transport system ATP-binding protein